MLSGVGIPEMSRENRSPLLIPMGTVRHTLHERSCAAADSPRLLLGFALGSVLDVQLDTSFFAMPGNRGFRCRNPTLLICRDLCFSG